MRILPRGPSNSIRHSNVPTGWGATSSTKDARGGLDVFVRLTGEVGPASRLSFPYSKCKTCAVRQTPCSLANSTAAAHSRSGIGKRPVCAFLQRSKRPQTFRMSLGITDMAIVGLLTRLGFKTDTTNYGWTESCKLAGRTRTTVEARVQADYVELWHEGVCLARHERCYSRHQQILDLEHYLDVLQKKPGALAGSTPLAQWRQAGRWPGCFDYLWQALNTRHGRQQGTRQMIELLSLGTSEGWDRLRFAVEQALALGCQDVAAIRYLLSAGRLAKSSVAPIEVGLLARYERPQPVLSGYDQLLGKAEVQA